MNVLASIKTEIYPTVFVFCLEVIGNLKLKKEISWVYKFVIADNLNYNFIGGFVSFEIWCDSA